MSAAPGLDTARPRPALRPSTSRRPALSLVPTRRPSATLGALGRTPFVVLVVGLLAAGLLGLLALHTALAQDAFELHTLKQDSRELEDREQLLQREVEALRAPQALATRAEALGMVPAGPPAFLRLSDGVVLGASEPVTDIGGLSVPTSASAPDGPAAEAPAAEAPAAEASADGSPASETAAPETPVEQAEEGR